MLPAGDWEASFEELRASVLVKGPGDGYPHWDASWRAVLVDRLEFWSGSSGRSASRSCSSTGPSRKTRIIPTTSMDTSIATRSGWSWGGGLQDELNQLDPHRTWSWDPAERCPYRGYPKQQLPMWHQYRIELYPHTPGLIAGHDHRGHALEFPSWFRLSRRPLASGAEEKGIVKLRRTA